MEREAGSEPVFGECGTGASPALAGDQIIILNDNEKQPFIASHDKRTGKRLWRTDREVGTPARKTSWTTPFVWRNALRTEIVAVGAGTAVSYDLQGKELWRLPGMAAIAIPSPFAYDGWLYVNGGHKGTIFAVKPGASGDISSKDAEGRSNEHIAWSDAKGGSYLPTPVAYDGGLYVLNEMGILTRFDATTGQQSYKSRLGGDGGGSGAFTSSPWAYNGKIFCLDEEGTTYVVRAGATFEALHVNSQDEMALATPAMADDRLLLRTETKLYSLRKK